MKCLCACLVNFLPRWPIYIELSIIICVSFHFCWALITGDWCTWSWEETEPEQLDPADLRNIPDHTGLMLSTGGKKRDSVMAFVFSSYVLRSCSFLGMAKLLLVHGKWGINSLGFFLLTYAAFALPIKVSQPTGFLTFIAVPLSPTPLLQQCWAWVPSEVKPQQFASKSLWIWNSSFITLSCLEPCCIAFAMICHNDLYKAEKYLLGEISPLIECAIQWLHGKNNPSSLFCSTLQNCSVILQSVLGILNYKAKERCSELRAELEAGREKGKKKAQQVIWWTMEEVLKTQVKC